MAAGTIPSILIFGPFGRLGDAALKDLATLPRDSLTELAVALNIFQMLLLSQPPMLMCQLSGILFLLPLAKLALMPLMVLRSPFFPEWC